MIDTTRVLQPLTEAEGAIRKLDDYESTAELASAVQQTWDAVERTLRQLLRADESAPDWLRLKALSKIELPANELLPALRQRDAVSLEMAGMAHDLEQAAIRAERGDVRASDADIARNAVAQVRTDVARNASRTAPGGQPDRDRPVRAAAHGAVTSGAVKEPVHSVPKPPKKRNWKRILPVPIAAVLVISLGIYAANRETDLDRGIEAFQADRLEEAEQHFRAASEGRDAATARLYLARIYRQQNRLNEAADVLRVAAAESPDDPEVRRELGKLFLDLNSPQRAVEQFRRAQELAPDVAENWIWLIRAMRLAGDPQAEVLLRQAPPEVQAAMSRSNP